MSNSRELTEVIKGKRTYAITGVLAQTDAPNGLTLWFASANCLNEQYVIVWLLNKDIAPNRLNFAEVIKAYVERDPVRDPGNVAYWIYKAIDALGEVNKALYVFSTKESTLGGYVSDRAVTRIGVVDDQKKRDEYKKKREWILQENERRRFINESRKRVSEYKFAILAEPDKYRRFVPSRYPMCDSWYELPVRSRITKPRPRFTVPRWEDTVPVEGYKASNEALKARQTNLLREGDFVKTEVEFNGRATPEFIAAIEAIIAYETEGVKRPGLPERNALPKRAGGRKRRAVSAKVQEGAANEFVSARASEKALAAAAKAMGVEDKMDWEE